MNEMPNCPIIRNCHCYPIEEAQANKAGLTHCVCGDSEKALRQWSNDKMSVAMTTPQREWCLAEIENVEGFEREQYKDSTDAQLALGVISAWSDYCKDKGLL